MKAVSFCFILLCALVTSCQMGGKPDNFDYGQVENSKYTNTFFNFEITIPEGWFVQSREQVESLTAQGQDLVAGDDKKMKAVLKASEVNTANLLMAYQYEVGATVDYNPGIFIVAENTKSMPGIKIGSDYLFHARKLLDKSDFKYDEVDDVFEKEVINGTDFYKMNAILSYGGFEIHQTYYSTVRQGFSFSIVISYVDDKQLSELMSAVKSAKFL